MHDAERLSVGTALRVRVVECVEDLARDVHGEPHRQSLPPVRAGAQKAERVHAVDVLERDVVLPLDLAELEDLDDLRVLQGALQLGLVDEHGEELGVGGKVGQDPLDDEDLLEAVRSRLARTEDLCHSTDGKAFEQLIPAERTRYECRR